MRVLQHAQLTDPTSPVRSLRATVAVQSKQLCPGTILNIGKNPKPSFCLPGNAKISLLAVFICSVDRLGFIALIASFA